MVAAVLIWVGAVLAVGLLLVMALGPAIVELDSWWYERRHARKAVRRAEERQRARELARV